VSLSDIAAMGGTPRHAFLTIALPASAGADFASGFRDGFGQLAERFHVNLLGGDVSRSPSGLFITVAVLGEAERNRVLYRDGAKVGDRVFVTGHLGLAAAGLERLRSHGSRAGRSAHPLENSLVRALLRPEPRVPEGHALAATGVVTSCIDVSDGLALDLTRLCTRSEVGVRVEEAAVPLAESLLEHTGGDRERALALALVGGENYELCFTVRPGDAGALQETLGARLDVPITDIGEIVSREEGFLRVREGRTPSPLAGGFDHFVD
jgi:thiamine-monophosphate kinase